jgi:hypothetical protein
MMGIEWGLAHITERSQEMIREAERQRLIHAILAAQPKPDRFYAPVLAGLGRALTGWGLRLQARYGASCDMAAVVDTLSGYSR